MPQAQNSSKISVDEDERLVTDRNTREARKESVGQELQTKRDKILQELRKSSKTKSSAKYKNQEAGDSRLRLSQKSGVKAKAKSKLLRLAERSYLCQLKKFGKAPATTTSNLQKAMDQSHKPNEKPEIAPAESQKETNSKKGLKDEKNCENSKRKSKKSALAGNDTSFLWGLTQQGSSQDHAQMPMETSHLNVNVQTTGSSSTNPFRAALDDNQGFPQQSKKTKDNSKNGWKWWNKASKNKESLAAPVEIEMQILKSTKDKGEKLDSVVDTGSNQANVNPNKADQPTANFLQTNATRRKQTSATKVSYPANRLKVNAKGQKRSTQLKPHGSKSNEMKWPSDVEESGTEDDVEDEAAAQPNTIVKRKDIRREPNYGVLLLSYALEHPFQLGSNGQNQAHNGQPGPQPQDGQQGLQPQDGQQGLQPHDGQQGLQPHDGQEGLQPQDGQPGPSNRVDENALGNQNQDVGPVNVSQEETATKTLILNLRTKKDQEPGVDNGNEDEVVLENEFMKSDELPCGSKEQPYNKAFWRKTYSSPHTPMVQKAKKTSSDAEPYTEEYYAEVLLAEYPDEEEEESREDLFEQKEEKKDEPASE